MEVTPRIIRLLMSRPTAESFRNTEDPYRRIEIADEILQSELTSDSKLLTEINQAQDKIDAKSYIKDIWGASLDLLGLQVVLSREATSVALKFEPQTKTLEVVS